MKVKVSEVGQKDVKYKMFDNADGPLLSIPTSDLLKVTYENGAVYDVPQVKAGNGTGQSLTKKGNIFVAGSAGFAASFIRIKPVYSGTTGSTEKQNSISFTPSVDFFIMDNLAVGLSTNIAYASSPGSSGTDKATQIMLVPTMLYFVEVGGKAKPFFQLGLGYASMTTKYTPTYGSEEKITYSGPCMNAGAGVAFFVRNNISINFGLSYTKTVLTDSDDSKYQEKEGNIGSNLGISIYL